MDVVVIDFPTKWGIASIYKVDSRHRRQHPKGLVICWHSCDSQVQGKIVLPEENVA
jgi:hypothetical protein